MTSRRQKSFWVWFFIGVLKIAVVGALVIGGTAGLLAFMIWVTSHGYVFTFIVVILFFSVAGTIAAYQHWKDEVKR